MLTNNGCYITITVNGHRQQVRSVCFAISNASYKCISTHTPLIWCMTVLDFWKCSVCTTPLVLCAFHLLFIWLTKLKKWILYITKVGQACIYFQAWRYGRSKSICYRIQGEGARTFVQKIWTGKEPLQNIQRLFIILSFFSCHFRIWDQLPHVSNSCQSLMKRVI